MIIYTSTHPVNSFLRANKHKELIDVLERADNEDLKTLCDIITLRKDGTPRISDSLTKTEVFRRNYPHSMKPLIPHILRELGLYGSNTFVSIFKRKVADYSTILRKVAKRLKVNFRDSQSDEEIEGYMLQKLFDDMSEKLSDEDLRTIAHEFGVKSYDIAGSAYHVIVPAVIQIAYLRKKVQMSGLAECPEADVNN